MKALKILSLPMMALLFGLMMAPVESQAQGLELTIVPGTPFTPYSGIKTDLDCFGGTYVNNTWGPQGVGGVWYPGSGTDAPVRMWVTNSGGAGTAVYAPGWGPTTGFLPGGVTVFWDGYYGCVHPAVVVIFP